MTPAGTLTGLMIETTAGGTYKAASTFPVTPPTTRTEANAHIFDDAERMKQRAKNFVRGPKAAPQKLQPAVGIPKVGRNEPCRCKSGLKYKKCHGR